MGDIVDLLAKCHYSESEWNALGLALGLHKNTLDSIESDNNKASNCLRATLSAWLNQKDSVDNKGGPTISSLIEALRNTNNKRVANKVEEALKPKPKRRTTFRAKKGDTIILH